MVAIGRTLMTRPRFLLLDEPFAGLAAAVKERIATSLTTLAQAMVPVLLSEHDLESVTEVAGRVVGLRNGRVVFDGTPQEFSESANQLVFG